MARTGAVEYERVAEACSSLFLEGKSPSFESVYELIGGKAEAAAEESNRSQRSSEEAAGEIEGYQNRIRTLANGLAMRAAKQPSREDVGS